MSFGWEVHLLVGRHIFLLGGTSFGWEAHTGMVLV